MEPSSSLHAKPFLAFNRLSVIIPVYNEVIYLPVVLRAVHATKIPKEIIIVDDGSSDGTREFLKRLQDNLSSVFVDNGTPTSVKIIFHEKNQGKGAAVRTGISYATGEITIIQDADLEYDPADYQTLIGPILSGEADVVFGSRFRGERQRVLYFWHAVANQILTFFSNMLTNLNLTDMETGYKAFSTDIIKRIPIRSRGFGFEPEVTAKVAKLRCRIYEVPISYHGRSYEEGKKITWKDGIRALFTIVRFWLVEDLFAGDAGLRVLRIMEGATSYNQWLYTRCKKFLGQTVLEVGSGTGNITKLLLNRPKVVASDYDPLYVRNLELMFGKFLNVTVERIDLTDKNLMQNLGRKYAFDCALSMNVLEHIEDDRLALKNICDLLQPGGRLVLLVPAHQALYSNLDRSILHHRRYSQEPMRKMLQEAGFEVEVLRYHNWLGAIGWWVNGRILRRELVPSRQLRLFDFLIALLKIEDYFHLPFGLSLLAVARKKA